MNFGPLIFLVDSSEIIRLHDMSIERFGGASGLRDIGLLESAASQPVMMIYYGDDDDRKIYNLAAAYFFHIIKNHPFVRW